MLITCRRSSEPFPRCYPHADEAIDTDLVSLDRSASPCTHLWTSMMESRPTESIADRNILIVGGGLAGLAFATYLARAGAEPTIVERRTEWGDGGYGIGLWGDGHAVLNDLDCPLARPLFRLVTCALVHVRRFPPGRK